MTRHVNTNGPDWADLLVTMGSMENYHGVRMSLLLLTKQTGQFGGLSVHAVAVKDGGTSIELNGGWVVTGVYPSARHQTIEGLIYRLLLELDNKLGQDAWKQTKISEG